MLCLFSTTIHTMFETCSSSVYVKVRFINHLHILKLTVDSLSGECGTGNDLFLEIISGYTTRALTLLTITSYLHFLTFGPQGFKMSAMWPYMEKVCRPLS